ncbi:hypothetical protein [Candidatus Pelagibacter sp. HIMB1623]|uniref:hypothetical protein n=1 Tax=Candidatus Pelagibacter sp. HIMB1623 TaxID=3413358 RepID=UPI003F82569A
MIRFIKNNFLENPKFEDFKKRNFKRELFLKFQKIKSRIYPNQFISNTPELKIEKNNLQDQNVKIFNEPIKKQINLDIKITPERNKEIINNDNKFLKKKLKRKLGRLKRKIKRYKVSSSENINSKKIVFNMNEGDEKLNQLNLKIKEMQNELSKIHEADDKDSQDVIKVKNKYKRKIKKLRNKINKLTKNNEKVSNVVNLKTTLFENDRVDETKQLKEQPEVDLRSEEIIDLESQLDFYKKENQELKNEIDKQNSSQKINQEQKNITEELELKIKHYQDENIRLSNLITSQNRKIEIMSSQIQNFENLKNKLYQQVNILGDTLLDNDNVENIFENNSMNNEKELAEENSKEVKVVNSDNISIKKEYTPKVTRNLEVNDNYLDQEINKIFSE